MLEIKEDRRGLAPMKEAYASFQLVWGSGSQYTGFSAAASELVGYQSLNLIVLICSSGMLLSEAISDIGISSSHVPTL